MFGSAHHRSKSASAPGRHDDSDRFLLLSTGLREPTPAKPPSAASWYQGAGARALLGPAADARVRRPDPQRPSVCASTGFIERAGSKIQDAEKALEVSRLDVTISNSIESMEFSAKATFLLLHKSHPKKHNFADEEVAPLLRRVPQPAKLYNFPRLFVLNKFWQIFYTPAKYGIPEWDLSARALFNRKEAELAIAHAREWNTAIIILRNVS